MSRCLLLEWNGWPTSGLRVWRVWLLTRNEIRLNLHRLRHLLTCTKCGDWFHFQRLPRWLDFLQFFCAMCPIFLIYLLDHLCGCIHKLAVLILRFSLIRRLHELRICVLVLLITALSDLDDKSTLTFVLLLRLDHLHRFLLWPPLSGIFRCQAAWILFNFLYVS